ncbi:tetratricopeptide repeat protein, partial [Desulfosarcina cetonica]|uniref:tetratricopeptide repeat protein n=1 Tax=Desulfosarcina cetonica TaxID=90730 RepID=UPI0012ED483D
MAPENSAKINEASQLRPHLPAGLYYFDNLESVAESQRGIKLLREMIQIPGIRILASSRVTLDGVLGSSIFVGKLDTASAVKLFLKCWSGFSAPDAQELNEFVDKQLGGHALSITLLSRLGRAYSWQALQQQWFKQGTAIAKSRKASDRLDSLEISFALTAKLLAEEPGALNLWQFAALFSDGFDEETLNMWCEISGHSQARIALFDHHLLINTNGCITMLPPIARFASGHTAIADSEYAFDWNNARKYAYHYFLDLSRNASKIISDDVNVESRIKSSQQLWAIDQLLSTDINFSSPDIELIKRLHSQLRNVYSFNVLAGQAVLGRVNQLIGDALSKKLLGDLERRLGNVDQARGHYDHAIELYQKEQDQLGLANALQALGDLESRLGNVDQARGHY